MKLLRPVKKWGGGGDVHCMWQYNLHVFGRNYGFRAVEVLTRDTQHML
jgi:hypothetical protein